ncbi:MAG: hypothetical protein KKD01_00130 [Proteobacteria bacterium]|nr:hypothetical protein [Pseudomonadota bacterium]MBU1417550.1 hypothetical protein [Pseudomonadota bacterium]MBU1453103.1 hypothetical protein [Pseudomonadota bacterium]
MIKDISPAEVRGQIEQGETFVVNIVASWCPDCIERQRPHLPGFVEKVAGAGIPVCQCTVQEEKMVFISAAHEALTNDFGGHGYPRTLLVIKGEVEDSRVEVMDPLSLDMLATEYIERVRSAFS